VQRHAAVGLRDCGWSELLGKSRGHGVSGTNTAGTVSDAWRPWRSCRRGRCHPASRCLVPRSVGYVPEVIVAPCRWPVP